MPREAKKRRALQLTATPSREVPGRAKAASSPASSPLHHYVIMARKDGGLSGKDGEAAKVSGIKREEWTEESPGAADAALQFGRLWEGSVET